MLPHWPATALPPFQQAYGWKSANEHRKSEFSKNLWQDSIAKVCNITKFLWVWKKGRSMSFNWLKGKKSRVGVSGFQAW